MKCIKKLNKRPRMEGINRVGNWTVVDQYIGKKDGKANLSDARREGITPWIEKKCHYYKAYANKTYLLVTKALEKLYKEVYIKSTELDCFINNTQMPYGRTGEADERMAAMQAQLASAEARKRKEILVSLSEIKAELETVDKALSYNLERAEQILKVHIDAYWKGYVTESSEKNFYPNIQIDDINAVNVYSEHFKKLNNILDNALKDFEKEKDYEEKTQKRFSEK